MASVQKRVGLALTKYVRNFTGTITRTQDGQVVIAGTGPETKDGKESGSIWFADGRRTVRHLGRWSAGWDGIRQSFGATQSGDDSAKHAAWWQGPRANQENPFGDAGPVVCSNSSHARQ